MGAGLPQIPHHIQAVAAIAERVRHLHSQKIAVRIYHGSTNSTRKSQYRTDNIVDISRLDRVLDISPEDRIAYVEPNVPMDKLVNATLQYGLIPPVVMEFPGITAGGGFAGTSAESSSFKYGLFDRTVKSVEIVLGNGDVIIASEQDKPDLFYGAAGSCGTLGIVTMLAIILTPAKPFVALKYIRVHGIEDALLRMQQEQSNSTLDYLDGVFFSKTRGVLCLGNLVDHAPPGVGLTRFSRPRDDWFYINAEKLSTYNDEWTDYVPIVDYLFRYDRGAFWMGKYTYRYFAIPLNKFTRWLLDPWTHTRIMYQALHKSGLSDKFIIQDVAIPYENSSEFFSYVDSEFQHYPIWICPLRLSRRSTSSSNGMLAFEHGKPESRNNGHSQAMLNFGVWGPGPQNAIDFTNWNKAFEDKVRQLDGSKWLYAHVFYSAKQFWEIYDFAKYDELRKKYHAFQFPSLYDKVKMVCNETPETSTQSWFERLCILFWSIWPLAGLYGWLQCFIAEDYLLSR